MSNLGSAPVQKRATLGIPDDGRTLFGVVTRLRVSDNAPRRSTQNSFETGEAVDPRKTTIGLHESDEGTVRVFEAALEPLGEGLDVCLDTGREVGVGRG